MKAELDPAIHFLRGTAGNFVYRKVRGKTILSARPSANLEPSPAQQAHRERFLEATQYGRSVLVNPAVRALYEREAKRRDVPLFSLLVADYFNLPVVRKLELNDYDRVAGSPIYVTATDDFEVVSVTVSLHDEQGALLEEGAAVNNGAVWVYTAQAAQTAPVIQVTALAADRPGGTAVKTETVTF